MDSLIVVGCNYSTAGHPQILLSWSSPAIADWTNTTIERAKADSIWQAIAIRPAGVNCLLDQDVEWALDYRYRIVSTSAGGTDTVSYSAPVSADEVAFLDLHDYFLPRRWRTHVYLVDEVRMAGHNLLYYAHVIQYRFVAEQQNESGGNEEIYEVVRRTNQDEPDTSYVRFITEFTNRVLFYSDTILTQYAVPSIWELRSVATPSWHSVPDSIRFLPLHDIQMVTPDSLELIFSVHGVRRSSNFVFRRDFGLIEGYIDDSGPLNQTQRHDFTIQLQSPLGTQKPDDAPHVEHPVLWPNPARTGSVVNVSLPADVTGSVTLAIHDLLGREILRKGMLKVSGTTAGTVETDGMCPGIYVLTVQSVASIHHGILLVQ